jgi:hypothetical protein
VLWQTLAPTFVRRAVVPARRITALGAFGLASGALPVTHPKIPRRMVTGRRFDILIEPAKIAAGPAPHLTAPGRGPQTAVWEIVWSTDTVRPLREAAERWLAKANEPISFRHNSLCDLPPAPQPQLLHLYEQCLPRGGGSQRCDPASPIVLFGDRRIAGTT